MAEAHLIEADGRVAGIAAQKIPPEFKVFPHRERGFHGVAMAEVVRLFRQGQFVIAAFKLKRASRQRQQPGDHPQQGGFSRAVDAGDGEGMARRHLDVEVREYIAAAPHAFQTAPRKPHIRSTNDLAS